MAVDPLASIWPWPITVTLGGRDFVIPALPAAGWLAVLLAGDEGTTWAVVPGLLTDDDQEEVAVLLADGEVELAEVHDAALDAITVACGHDWWWGLRLLLSASQNWDRIHGSLLLHGVDPGRLSLAAYLNALYALVTRDLSQDKIQMLDLDLRQIPAGVAETLDEDTESEAFMQMMQQMQQLP